MDTDLAKKLEVIEHAVAFLATETQNNLALSRDLLAFAEAKPELRSVVTGFLSVLSAVREKQQQDSIAAMTGHSIPGSVMR